MLLWTQKDCGRQRKVLVEPFSKIFSHAFVVVDSTIHPDTGEAVFLPFRMSCFVPTNMVLVAGMLLPNPSVCIFLCLCL
jgi:hypothetical protein